MSDKVFVLSTDSDQHLNYFFEFDVEEQFKNGSRILACDLDSVECLQRWMRDSSIGDRRTIGGSKVEIICTSLQIIEDEGDQR